MESQVNSFDKLPKGKHWEVLDLYQYQGFWYRPRHLEAAMAIRSNFEAREDDVILVSSMKTGTTWLKALIPSIVGPKKNAIEGDDDDYDPFVYTHPNELIPSLEIQIYRGNTNPDISSMPPPRLFRTHLPYTMLSESIKSSSCKIVYITRDPKDVFVSSWHFFNSIYTELDQLEVPKQSIGQAFESFINGFHLFGPFHDHVLQYWKQSLERPEKVLFLRYEELKRDPRGQVKKLASFLGRPFENEEELDKVLWRCSLERLKDLEINKNGVDPHLRISYKTYLRKGTVGDWKNHLSQEMKDKLDNLTSMKLHGSGLNIVGEVVDPDLPSVN